MNHSTATHKLFIIACYVLIFISISHLIGHFMPITPVNETEAHLLHLMTSYQKSVLGGKMSMMDIQNGLSLCYSLFFLSTGIINLYLVKKKMLNHEGVRSVSLLLAVTFSIGTIICILYFFWLPVISFAIASLLFMLSFLKYRRAI